MKTHFRLSRWIFLFSVQTGVSCEKAVVTSSFECQRFLCSIFCCYAVVGGSRVQWVWGLSCCH